MSQTTQISPDAHHQAAQRLADALLDALTRECGRAHVEEGFETDDLIGVALTALTAVITQFAAHFGVDPDHLIAALVEAMSEESANRASRLN
jgi:hypothetical protein